MQTENNNLQFNVQRTNAPGSPFAGRTGNPTSLVVANRIRKNIYDTTPDNYYDDMKVFLMSNPIEFEMSDEFIYMENQWQWKALQFNPTGTISAGASQTLPCSNIDEVGIGFRLNHPSTNQTATVMSMDRNAGTVTIQANIGATLPQLSSGTYFFSVRSNGDSDGTNGFNSFYRLNDLIQRDNYIELFYEACRLDRVEGIKLRNNQTVEYLQQQRMNMTTRFQTSQSNSIWNGEQAYAPFPGSNGTTKLMGGIYPIMKKAGSYAITTSAGNAFNALATALSKTLKGRYGYDRLVYATPDLIWNLSKQTKFELVRFKSTGDLDAELQLNSINFGYARAILVNMQRFEFSSGCFPQFFEKTYFVVNQKSIKPVMLTEYAERVDKIPGRHNGGQNANNYDIEYIEGSLSMRYQDPLGGALITVS